jgi:outer membrane protein assembly factor BamB
LPDQLPAEGLKQAWKAKVGIGFTAVSVAGGRLYTMGNRDKSDTATLFCLDAATGKEIWTKEWPSPLVPTMYEGGPNATPVVDGGAVYAVVKPARVLRLKAATGEVEWDVQLPETLKTDLSPWGITAAPRIAGEDVILNYGSNGTVLDKRTGKMRWSTGTKGSSFNVPALGRLGGEPTLMVLATNALVGVRMKDGAEQFRHPFGEGYFCHASDPIVRGDEVFISSSDHGGQLVKFGAGQPEVRWKSREFGNFMSTPVLLGEHLYGINTCGVKAPEAALRCVEWSTGKVLWSEKGFGWGSVVAAEGNRLLVLSDKGELSLGKVSPAGFENLGRFQALGGRCWTPPVLANGRVYLRNAAGDLVCYEARPPAAS